MDNQGSLHYELQDALRTHSALVAIQDSERILNYAELSDAIVVEMERLKHSGIQKGQCILIVGKKSLNMLVAMLACLFSGVVYVPIELPMPEARLDRIANETLACARFDIGIGVKKLSEFTYPNSDTDVLIFYTSGSTGQPKGVRITHDNILSFVHWVQQQFSLTQSDRICAFAPWHFDLSILDIYATLLSGASLHCVDNTIKLFPYQMTLWLSQRQITLVYMVPSAIRHLVKHGEWSQQKHQSIRCILFAGEPYPLSELLQLRQAFPQLQIANLYGPTETNVCTYCEIPSLTTLSEWKKVPIGRALPDCHIYIFDEKLNELHQDETEGELVCAGPNVSPGYINDPLSLKFFNYQNLRAYKTGDYVQNLDGQFYFLGRIDRQIKLYGHRIDPHEIEAVLRRHNTVKDAAVCESDQQLIAFIVSEQNFTDRELANYCLNNLPHYACPKRFIQINRMPLTYSEKIDYQKLISEEFLYEVD